MERLDYVYSVMLASGKTLTTHISYIFVLIPVLV